MFSILVQDTDINDTEIPIMVTQFVLQIPNIVIIPSIEELQLYFDKVITNIIGIYKNVIMWGQRHYSTISKTESGNVDHGITNCSK